MFHFLNTEVIPKQDHLPWKFIIKHFCYTLYIKPGSDSRPVLYLFLYTYFIYLFIYYTCSFISLCKQNIDIDWDKAT